MQQEEQSIIFPNPINCRCYLGFCNLPRRNYISGVYAHSMPTEGKDQNVPISYQKQDRQHGVYCVAQAANGLLPEVNKYIGAPLATFAYGGIEANKIHPYAKYIKGPNYTEPSYETSENISSFTPTQNNIELPAPTIPINDLSSEIYTMEPKPIALTTYNIWQLDFTTIKKNINIKYVKNKGPIIDSPYIQIFDGSNFSIRVNALTEPITLKRIFPISKDLAYDENAYIYYPTKRNEKIKKYSSPTMATGEYGNCGFQIHLSATHISDTTGNGHISIGWGDKITNDNIEDLTISNYRIDLFEGKVPRLKYYIKHPKLSKKTKRIQYIELVNAPVFEAIGEYSVYVHYIGAKMLVGFTENPQDWFLIEPRYESEISNNTVLKHYISKNATINITFERCACSFQYGPIAFNNMYLQFANDVETKKLIEQYEKANKSTENIINTNTIPQAYFEATLNKHENIQFQELHQNFYDNVTTFDNIDVNSMFTIEADNRCTNRKTYGIDFKTINENDEKNNTNENNKKNNINVNIIWDGGICGSMLHSIYTTPVTGAYTNDFFNKLYEITNYVENWNIIISREAIASVYKTTANLTLMNLTVDSNGVNILKAILNNELLIKITVSYNNDNENVFFVGFITDVDIEYNNSSNRVSLRCVDPAYHLLENIIPSNPYDYRGRTIQSIMETVFYIMGLENYNKIEGNSNFINFIQSERMGFASLSMPNFLTQDSNENCLKIIKNVIERLYIPSKNIYGCMYWDFEKNCIKFTNVVNLEIDEFIFMAHLSDIELSAELKDSKGPKQLNTVNKLLMNSFITHYNYSSLLNFLRAYIIIQGQYVNVDLMDKELMNLNKVKDITNFILNNNNKRAYIGYRKARFESFNHLFLRSKNDLKEYVEGIFNTYNKKPFSTIQFTICVTKPLNHFSRFKIKLSSENLNNSQNETDLYFYSQVSYNFNKNNNFITADIQGTILPKYNFRG